MIFSVKDYRDIIVNLSETTWYDKILDLIFGHPEVRAYSKEIRSAISQPDFVFKSVRDQRSKLFFRKLTRNFFSDYYLLVVVKYVKEIGRTVGYISTVFITDKLPNKGKRLL